MNNLPRVTEILKGCGLIPTFGFTDEARDRGTAVHMACQYYDLGDLDESSLDPVLVPYLAGWKKFLADHKCEWTAIEQRMEHQTLGYRGTPDRVGYVNGTLLVVDVKSGASAKWHRWQLAAYAGMQSDPYRYLRMVVRLQDDGNYKKDMFPASNYPADFNVFCSALNIANVKILEGIK